MVVLIAFSLWLLQAWIYKQSEVCRQHVNDYMRRRMDKIDRNIYEFKLEFKDFKETVVGLIDSLSKRPN